MNNKISLSELLSQTGFFQSIHDVKVLTHIVKNPLKDTVKDICDETGLPDSKVYPALNHLKELGLVLKDSSHRPARYSFTDPQALKEFLQSNFDLEVENRKKGISLINKQIVNLWNSDEPELGQVAYLYRGNAIYDEILRIMKNSRDKIVLILSESFEPFLETIISEIPKLTARGVKVELAIPNGLTTGLENFIGSPENLLKLKVSVTLSNSYIVRDGKTMLNIIHRREESVAMLTNDKLLVKYIASCWNDTSCCIDRTNFLNEKNILNLEVLER
ncbi:MAG: winged helix DNA-binding protein [Candidatus Heimdallarchaeota archaeon]|nr:winged helix DNA-binding protein [Candidatus Heimdallarchaeota archaeon]